MAVLEWDKSGEHFYETGIEKVALFVQNNGSYGKGVAWSGVTAITEKPSGAENTNLYADNMKYLVLKSTEEFGATIEAYQYPDEFLACDGTAEVVKGVTLGQQSRSVFGLAYVTRIGNDTKFDDLGYKIHLVYGAQASPSEKPFQTINDSPEADKFSWEITTTPVKVDGYKPTSTIVIDSTKVDKEKLASFEAIIFGSASEEPTLPEPADVLSHFNAVVGG